MPISSRLATRPRMRISPSVGAVMRLISFSMVDLPAPLRPSIATASPRFTPKVTSFSAQNFWLAPQHRHGVAPVHAEGHVLQRPEFLVVGQVLLADFDVGVLLAPHAGEPAGQVAVQGAAADHAQAILLGDAVHLENPF